MSWNLAVFWAHLCVKIASNYLKCYSYVHHAKNIFCKSTAAYFLNLQTSSQLEVAGKSGRLRVVLEWQKIIPRVK